MATYTDGQCGINFVASFAAIFATQRFQPASISDWFERNLAKICICNVLKGREVSVSGISTFSFSVATGLSTYRWVYKPAVGKRLA